MTPDTPEAIPHVLAEDAPTPETAEGDTVDAVITIGGRRYVGADYDGERYCAECINEEYLRFGVEDPYRIPYGGPLPEGFESDCPGHACSNCLRQIEGQTLLHYDGVCHPDSCPDMTVYVADGDGSVFEAAELRRDGEYREVMFRESNRHGDRGNTMLVHEEDLRDPDTAPLHHRDPNSE